MMFFKSAQVHRLNFCQAFPFPTVQDPGQSVILHAQVDTRATEVFRVDMTAAMPVNINFDPPTPTYLQAPGLITATICNRDVLPSKTLGNGTVSRIPAATLIPGTFYDAYPRDAWKTDFPEMNLQTKDNFDVFAEYTDVILPPQLSPVYPYTPILAVWHRRLLPESSVRGKTLRQFPLKPLRVEPPFQSNYVEFTLPIEALRLHCLRYQAKVSLQNGDDTIALPFLMCVGILSIFTDEGIDGTYPLYAVYRNASDPPTLYLDQPVIYLNRLLTKTRHFELFFRQYSFSGFTVDLDFLVEYEL